MNRELHISNLPYAADEADLQEFIEQHCTELDRLQLILDHETGRSKGFAFATFRTEGAARAALQTLNGLNFQGRPMKVSEARGREPQRGGRPASGGGRPPTRTPGAARLARSTPPVRHAQQTFIHPYNFVPIPPDGLGPASRIAPFRREPPAPHDRHLAERFSGHLDCKLITCGPWFIPDPGKRAADHNCAQHKILGYFTLDAVDPTSWDKDRPETDTTRPAVPATSLRGMVRSVFETATLSCFSVFDPEGLDFRIGYDPGHGGDAVPNGRGTAAYVPVRVLSRNGDGSEQVQVLNGRRECDDDKTVCVVLAHAYSPRVLRSPQHPNTQPQAGQQTALWQRVGTLPDGAAIAAVINLTPAAKRNRKTNKLAYYYREAVAVVPADEYASLTVARGNVLIFGHLHRTGPNIENKHHERIFFRWATYNDPDSRDSLAVRCQQFLADREPALTAASDVVLAAERGLAGYAERLGEELRNTPSAPRPLRPNPRPPYPSDFVGKCRVEPGDLLYALVEGDTTVRGLYPVALPRLAHEHTRGELLPTDLHPCADPGELCPACRVFGWVRSGPQHAAQPGRVDAVAGHVRFTHAVLRGDWSDAPQRRAQLATLTILGSPKPTTTACYLRPRNGYANARQQRWPPVLQQTALHANLPLYRRDEAVLRGRKFYRRRTSVNVGSHEPAANGILRPPDPDAPSAGPERDSQNQTVHLLPANLEFGFRVFFDNLTGEELGALLFALTLRTPATWGEHAQLRHTLGHGKPLGLGTAEIHIESFRFDCFAAASHAHRYATVRCFDGLGDIAASQPVAPWPPEAENSLEQFGHAWASASQHHADLNNVRKQLVEMLRLAPSLPIHYPPNPEGGFEENFEWFKQNRDPKRGLGVLLPDPTDERATGGLPIEPSDQ